MLIKNHQSYISNKVFSGILVAVYLFSMAFPRAVYAMPEQRVNAQTAEIGSHVKPITVQAATWPIYFDLVLDETRGWICVPWRHLSATRASSSLRAFVPTLPPAAG